jgi:hypothetical protein
MKVVVQEVEGEGLESFLGKSVTLFCGVYIYTGKCVGVNASSIKLENASIVYETGSFNDPKWKDAQKIPCGHWYVSVAAIESFGFMKE